MNTPVKKDTTKRSHLRKKLRNTNSARKLKSIRKIKIRATEQSKEARTNKKK